MAKLVGLTVLELKALKARGKPYEVRDPAVTGGYVVVWPSKALSYVVRFRFQNANKKVTLGRFDPDANGLGEIRALAREAQNQLTAARKPSAEALDPAAAKKAARLAAAQAIQKERAVVKAANGAAARRLRQSGGDLSRHAWPQFASVHQERDCAPVREGIKRLEETPPWGN